MAEQLAGTNGSATETAAAAAVNVSELGKALDQTTISSASGVASPATGNDASDANGDDEPDAGDDEDDYEEDDDDDEYGNGFGDDGDLSMADAAANEDDEDDGDDVASSPIRLESIANAAPPKSKSPKKRGRTDSLKKMLPAPASQRHKQKDDSAASASGAEARHSTSSSTSDDSEQYGAQRTPPAKLLVKDRTGAGMGVPRPHLISNAVKQAPPAKEKSNPRRWSKHEDESLRLAVERSGERNWKAIADQVPGRNHTQCLQRWTKVLKPGLIKGHWTPEEDSKLRELVTEEKKNWGQVASLIPGRTSKQCRERWCNHLDPNINKGSYTEDEDKIIIEMQSKLGNRWSIIAQQLKGRTEDAVKIRWKSLMRGRRAAMKDEKHHSAAAMSAASSAASAASAHAMGSDAALLAAAKPKAAARTTPSRQKTRAASPVVKSEKAGASPASGADGTSATPLAPAVAPPANVAPLPPAMLELQPAPLSLDSDDSVGKLDGLDLAAAMNLHGVNSDDLVAASLHNFQMSQRYQSSHALNGGVPLGAGSTGLYPPTTVSQTISPANHAMYTASNGYSINAVGPPPPSAYTPLGAHGYSAMGYAMANNSFGAPPQSQLAMQTSSAMSFYSGVSTGMPPNVPPSYSQGGFGAPPPRHMYQAYGTSGGVFASTASPSSVGVSMATPSFHSSSSSSSSMPPSAMYGGGSFSGNGMAVPVSNAAPLHAAASVDMGLPPSSAAAGKMLNTPREEWGSSQTPRSQMILTEGHASAYELFHQQRVRLMLQERDKTGATLSSAPSPGQAMLTKELEANKERQKRQAIMQKGWKSAVEAMMASSDLSSLDDQQRFDGFLEKVTLSALDPTDDELISDIIADDSLDVETPVA